MQRAGELRDANRQDRPPSGTTRCASKHTVTRSTPSVGEHSGQIDAGAPAGQALLLEHALTGLVQDGHPRLLAIQSARIDVLDAQIETLSMEISRCLMGLDADEPPPKAAELPSTVEGKMAPGHPEVPRMCIRAKTLLDTIL
jgi:hypothetical protein